MSYDLNIDIARLLKDEPFFAALSRRVEKVSTTSIPTAAVGLNREAMQYEFLYNPAFFEKLTDRKSTRLNSSHIPLSRMPSSA